MLIQSFLRFFGHQEWIRFGIRERVVRLFVNPDTTPSKPFEVIFFGERYRGDFSTFIDWNTYYFGAYQIDELKLMKDLIKRIKDPIVLDIGANVGHHSLFISTISKEVHAFEPYPDVAEKIKEKININNIKNIRVYQVGLGEFDDELEYVLPDNFNSGTGTFINIPGSNKQTVRLPIKCGDTFLEKLNLSKVDFIKMDIEGFEPYALKGLKNTLSSQRPIVFFEWSGNARSLRSEPEKLFPEGYRFYDFNPDEVIFGVFKKRSYKLVEEAISNTDGNKLAIPEEKVGELFSKHN